MVERGLRDIDELETIEKTEAETVLAAYTSPITPEIDFDWSVVSFSEMDLDLIDFGNIVVKNIGPISDNI